MRIFAILALVFVLFAAGEASAHTNTFIQTTGLGGQVTFVQNQADNFLFVPGSSSTTIVNSNGFQQRFFQQNSGFFQQNSSFFQQNSGFFQQPPVVVIQRRGFFGRRTIIRGR